MSNDAPIQLQLRVTEDTPEAVTYELFNPDEASGLNRFWRSFTYFRKPSADTKRKLLTPLQELQEKVDAEIVGDFRKINPNVQIEVLLRADVRKVCINQSGITGRAYLPPAEYQTPEFFISLGEQLSKKRKPIDEAKHLLVFGWQRYGYNALSKETIAEMVNRLNGTNRSVETIWKTYVTNQGLLSNIRSGPRSKA